jgi:hypothetical protein
MELDHSCKCIFKHQLKVSGFTGYNYEDKIDGIEQRKLALALNECSGYFPSRIVVYN